MVYNYEPLIPRKSLRANLYGKFVAIRGTAVRVSNIKPFCSKLALVCNSCLMGNTPYPLSVYRQNAVVTRSLKTEVHL
uniref:Minichromosome maintenance 8 homologous recombination repair factor n=1 Tax=Cyprinus carpio carpio TaxID=630221 RepID=A0A9J7XN64_CYPCA